MCICALRCNIYQTESNNVQNLKFVFIVFVLKSFFTFQFSVIIPACIRRMTGGYVFTGVCLFIFRGRGPPSFLTGGVSHPSSPVGGRDTTILPDWQGYHILPDGRYPTDGAPPIKTEWGLPPSPQTWKGGMPCPDLGRGYPCPDLGWEYPPSRPGKGYFSRSGPRTGGYPQP